jgi:hypothetical protein
MFESKFSETVSSGSSMRRVDGITNTNVQFELTLVRSVGRSGEKMLDKSAKNYQVAASRHGNSGSETSPDSCEYSGPA